MAWHQSLLLHWPIAISELRHRVPQELEIDTCSGHAWVTIQHYRVRNLHPAIAPAIPWFSSFLQIDARTYVRQAGEPGIFFFSLDATNPVAVWLARTVLKLPAFRAAIHMRRQGQEFHLNATRTHHDAPRASLDCRWSPREPINATHQGELVSFISTRTRLFAQHEATLLTCSMRRATWSFRRAHIQSLENSFPASVGLPFPATPPIAHHADALGLEVWPQRTTSAQEMAAWLDTAPYPRA